MKKCTRCKIDKEEDEFYKQASTHDGLAYECKECKDERHRIYRENRIAERNEVIIIDVIRGMKRCTKCSTTKFLREYNKGSDKDGLAYECKECNSNRNKAYQKSRTLKQREALSKNQKEYREANKEKMAAYAKRYRETHKEYYKKYNEDYRKL